MSPEPFELEDDDFDYWRLCDELSIFEAALLIAGASPSQNHHVENWDVGKTPLGYEAAKTAITNALRAGRIKGTIEPEYISSFNREDEPIPDSISLRSRVEVASLKEWLAGRGFRRGFFFPDKTEAPDYLDPKNPRFAPKLAAAVLAWQSVVDPGSRHPKAALTKWLREHAAELGLTDDEGKLNETGIEEAAKVANWKPGGGAPKTPFGQNPPED